MKYFKTLVFICSIGLLYTSCVKKANYPISPVITYNSFTPFCSGSSTDSAFLRINFTDGNGDIGYPSQQANVTPNLYIVPLIYVYAQGAYFPIISDGDTITFSYNVPYITPVGSDKELSGIIQVNFEKFIQEYISSDTAFNAVANIHQLEFKVWLFDRAGNKSNVLVTSRCYTCQ